MKVITKLLKYAGKYVFPADIEKTPQAHAETILMVLESQFDENTQSDILTSLKTSMINDRVTKIELLTADLEKLKKI